MKLEPAVVRYVAAGGVVVDQDRVLVLGRPSRNEVRLPKGHVESGETLESAALREVCEESGYCDLVVTHDLGSQEVEFTHKRRRIARSERYFRMALTKSPPLITRAETQFEPTWLSWNEAEVALSFEPEREWVRRARCMT